ncbi:hypothetical protein QTP88_008769 [Uroleucon formosanum]
MDIPKTDNTPIATFADDTSILSSNDDITIAAQHLQEHLNRIDNWANNWMININESKSSQVTFAIRPGICPTIRVLNSEIKAYLSRTRQIIWYSNMGDGLTSNIRPIQSFQNIALLTITSAPRYMTYLSLHNDLKVINVTDCVKIHYHRFHSKLNSSTNPLIRGEIFNLWYKKKNSFEFLTEKQFTKFKKFLIAKYSSKRVNNNYSIGEFGTIDETLVAFRGRCPFKMYIPSKPAKYGIKVFSLVDVKMSYTYNLEVYTGKQPPGSFNISNKPEDVKRKIVDENKKYSEEWEEKYFFIIQNTKLMYLICRETVAVFKEYNVKRHYETKHNDYLKFSSEVKQSKLREFTSQLKTQQKMFSSALQQPSNIIKASYSVSFLIAKKMKKFSDGEFVKECLEAVAKDILPDKNKLFSNISLSRQTVCRRINDISNEIIVKLRDRIQDFKYFSIAFDESTDISDTAQLVIFVRGVNESFQITEEMLKLISLKGTTKGEDIFHAVENSLCENNLDLEIISGISTDGAPAMVGKEKGAIKLLIDRIESTRKTNNFWKRDDLFIIHCLIHQQNLCSQVLSMNHVMQVVIKTVNYIRSHALTHCSGY